jgi:hypothetical protein
MARKQSSHGLSFIAAYTLSKTLTDSDSALYYPGYLQDFYNRKLEKSVASFDHPQSLKLTWIYDLPFGRGRRWLNSGKTDRLFSGWQVTAIQQYLSGDPLQIFSSDGVSITPGVRADIVTGVKQTVPLSGLDVINGTPYLNPAAFADPPLIPDICLTTNPNDPRCAANNGWAIRVGTAPRFLSHTRGPSHVGEDVGFIKNTRLTERVTFQIRADMFNFFNRTGRGNPDTGFNDGSFGLVFGPDHGARVVQFAARFTF